MISLQSVRRCVFARLVAAFVALATCASVRAEPPAASYIFPAGGQRGTQVDVRVGGLFLHDGCSFEMLGPGVTASRRLQRIDTIWFEGPLLPLPESQQAEDYPRDLAGQIELASDAPLGVRYWRVWTSQGAAPAMRFIVGELPEVIEQEIEGSPVPVAVKFPVTVNGRIFPREDVDVWSVGLQDGQSIVCELSAARFGSPLEPRLELIDESGRVVSEDDGAKSTDPLLRFTAPQAGRYYVRVQDVAFRGGQSFVYRLTITDGPFVERVYPLGGRRGSTSRFTLFGQKVPTEPVEITLPSDAAALFHHQVQFSEERSNLIRLDLDDLAEYTERESNEPSTSLSPVELGSVCNGRVDTAGDVDLWSFNGRAGQAVDLEVRAAQLGSPLAAVLVVQDVAGKELARAEAATGDKADPRLHFVPPSDGVFVARVHERFASRGGPAFAYRLRIAHPPAPEFRLHFASDAVSVARGTETKLKISVDRIGGFAEPIALTLEGLPAGVSASPVTIDGKQAAGEVALRADSNAVVAASRVTVRGSAKLGDTVVTRTAIRKPVDDGTPLDSLLVAVAMPTPFKIIADYDMRWAPRGSGHTRRYRIERMGYDGPIEVRLADRQARHLQGVTGETITVPAGATEFDYHIQFPPWMEMGRTSRSCVMGSAVIRDTDGSEHVVSFSSTAQNEQIIAVIGPARLDLELGADSVLVLPGQTTSVPVSIVRASNLGGPAELEVVLPSHARGIQAERVVVAATDTEATIALSFAPDAGPFHAPVVVRVTVTENGRRVVAEKKLELLSIAAGR